MNNLKKCDSISNENADILFALYSDVWKEWNSGSHGTVTLKNGTKSPIYFTSSYDENTHLSALYHQNRCQTNIQKGTIIFASKENCNSAIIFRYGYSEIAIIEKHDGYFTIDELKDNNNFTEEKIKYQYSDGGLYGSFHWKNGVKVNDTKSDAFQRADLWLNCLLKTKHTLTKANQSKGGKVANKKGNTNAKRNIIFFYDEKGNELEISQPVVYSLMVQEGYKKTYNAFRNELQRKGLIDYSNVGCSLVRRTVKIYTNIKNYESDSESNNNLIIYSSSDQLSEPTDNNSYTPDDQMYKDLPSYEDLPPEAFKDGIPQRAYKGWMEDMRAISNAA